MASKQPAHRVLSYVVPAGESYIDIASALSKINRRLYRQGMQYAIQKIEYSFVAPVDAVTSQHLTAYAAGDTWVVHNAWRKAQAHWLAQQRSARALIGESAKPTWEDFKVYLDDAHRAGTSLSPISGDGGAVGAGEWDYSKLVWEDNAETAFEPWVHLIGGDVAATDVGLILAYQQSRATVQDEDPDLPTEYSTNIYAKMARDENEVLDDVAQNMESENDEPPYDHDDYPGSDTNCDRPWVMETASASSGSPNATLDGFISECGLVLFNNVAYDPAGNPASAVTMGVSVHVAPGGYKGVAAIPMGQ